MSSRRRVCCCCLAPEFPPEPPPNGCACRVTVEIRHAKIENFGGTFIITESRPFNGACTGLGSDFYSDRCGLVHVPDQVGVWAECGSLLQVDFQEYICCSSEPEWDDPPPWGQNPSYWPLFRLWAIAFGYYCDGVLKHGGQSGGNGVWPGSVRTYAVSNAFCTEGENCELRIIAYYAYRWASAGHPLSVLHPMTVRVDKHIPQLFRSGPSFECEFSCEPELQVCADALVQSSLSLRDVNHTSHQNYLGEPDRWLDVWIADFYAPFLNCDQPSGQAASGIMSVRVGMLSRVGLSTDFHLILEDWFIACGFNGSTAFGSLECTFESGAQGFQPHSHFLGQHPQSTDLGRFLGNQHDMGAAVHNFFLLKSQEQPLAYEDSCGGASVKGTVIGRPLPRIGECVPP